ncbi:MAG: methyl-accepting chemotaxis protein [Ghiorsea sp.]
MRNNQPVNNTEHRMKPVDILVSKTDLKGIITYANKAFCDIAGMSQADLIGHPHNVVRHPDMPAAAFEDLWNTVKKGKPWTGFVKNRSGDGGFYWVKANVAPEFDDNGQMMGYISVRTCPTQAEINTLSSVYADVNAGKTHLPSSLHFSLLNRLNIKTKMLTSGILSIATLLVMSWFIYHDMSVVIDKEELQAKGLRYITAIRGVAEHLPQHRGMSNAYLLGNTDMASRVRNKAQDVDRAFDKLSDLDAQYHDALHTKSMLKGIRHSWSRVQKNWNNAQPAENFAAHSKVIADLLDLSMHVGGTSGFLSADSIAMVMSASVLTSQSLEMMEYTGRMRGFGAGLASQGSMSQAEKEKLIRLQGTSAVYIKLLESSLSEAIEDNSALQGYKPALHRVSQASESFLTLTSEELLHKKIVSIDSDTYFSAGTSVIQEILAMFDTVALETEQHLSTNIAKDTEKLQTITVSLLFISFFLTVLIIFTMVSIFKPLKIISDVMRSIVSNDYTSGISKNQDNELGNILDLIKITQSRLQFEIFESKSMSMQVIADEKLRRAEQLKQETELASRFESNVGTLVSQLSANASQVESAMQGLSQIADNLNDQTLEASAGVEESSDYVNNTAAAIEEMSASTADVMNQINATLEVSEKAVHEASSTSDIMLELEKGSEEIGSVIATISDIAEQTNLLALNASIEAARAGDAGRGFAVVAGEVKELANQTTSATEKIRRQIEHIQTQSNEATNAIKNIQEIIAQVNSHSQHVATAMEQQTEATREISSGAQHANSSMHGVQASVSDVTEAAKEVDDSAEQSLVLVQQMLEQTSSVDTNVQEFVAQLRN